jgi:acyl-CoA dehydrogenase
VTVIDHEELRRGVREVCAAFPDAYWRELDAKRQYPEEAVAALTKAGYLAPLIPEEYGGLGLDIASASIILEEINRSGGNAQPAHAQVYTMGTLLRHGSDEQKQAYLPGIASGALRLQAFGVTEPEAGTDTTSLRTTAVRDGDEYVINGRKMYISRVQFSDLMILLARTTPRDEVKRKSEVCPSSSSTSARRLAKAWRSTPAGS